MSPIEQNWGHQGARNQEVLERCSAIFHPELLAVALETSLTVPHKVELRIMYHLQIPLGHIDSKEFKTESEADICISIFTALFTISQKTIATQMSINR